MAQIFPKRLNWLAIVVGVGAISTLVGTVAFVWYYFSPKYTDVGFQPVQPVPYSHAVHVGKLGLDCRYCHTWVEVSQEANLPPVQTCMNCHKIIKTESEKIAPIVESFETGFPLRWVRIHNLPDYAYFNHAVHVRAGVGCQTCHGQINEMEVVWQVQPLSMSWCLGCHRNPAPYLRPTEEVTNMEWVPPDDQAEFAARVIEEKHLRPPVDCSGCHR